MDNKYASRHTACYYYRASRETTTEECLTKEEEYDIVFTGLHITGTWQEMVLQNQVAPSHGNSG